MDILIDRNNLVHWDWLIWLAMFVAGVAAGAYVVAALLESFGRGRAPVARVAQGLSFLVLILAPILLTVDLGHPERFWHMVIQSKTLAPMLKAWSPMSLGSVLLTLFGAVTFISFLDMLVARGTFAIGPWRRNQTIHGSPLGLILTIVGGLLAIAVGAYSGVLLSVTNIPGWTNTVLIGAVYVATSFRMGIAGVVLVQTLRGHPDADLSALEGTSTWLIVWWLILMVVFFITLGEAARYFMIGLPAVAMILAIVLGGLVPLGLHFMRRTVGTAVASAGLVLLAGLLVRYAIVMGPQTWLAAH